MSNMSEEKSRCRTFKRARIVDDLDKETEVFAPSFSGTISSSIDFQNIFTAARCGCCHIIRHRTSDWVRTHGLCEGMGYVYDTEFIKRWTDGITWSDSIHPHGASVMIYHELKRDTKQPKRLSEVTDGLRKKTLKDPFSSLKIVYYYKERYYLRMYFQAWLVFYYDKAYEMTYSISTWDQYGTLALFNTENMYSGHDQSEIDSAFLLLGLRYLRFYSLPGGQTHKEWTTTANRLANKPMSQCGEVSRSLIQNRTVFETRSKNDCVYDITGNFEKLSDEASASSVPSMLSSSASPPTQPTSLTKSTQKSENYGYACELSWQKPWQTWNYIQLVHSKGVY